MARVKRLRMSSPVDAALGVPDPVSAVMAMAFSLVTLGIQVQRFKRRRLENASLEIENEAKAANAKYEKALAEFRTNVVERLATEFSAPAPDPEKLSSLTDLATSIQNLSEQDLDEVRMLNPPSKTG